MITWAWCLLTLAVPQPGPASGVAIDFDTQVVPILTKVGCNAGACHGASAGRGGFNLSLLGADPAADFQAIVWDQEGRRINRVRPEESLLLRKPTGELEHGGGALLELQSAEAELILDWLRSGAQRPALRRLTEWQVTPKIHLCQQRPWSVDLKVTATFEGEQPIDVTAWTSFKANDPSSLTMEGNHRVTALRRGQHILIARYLDRIVPIQIMVPLSDHPVASRTELEACFIDRHISSKLVEMRISESPAASDSVWLRRVSLDLTGRLPDPDQVLGFLKSDEQNKRARWIETLLNSPEFSDYWTFKFARLLRLHSKPNELESFTQYRQWLHGKIRDDVGFDQLTKELLTTDGDAHRVGPANFGRMVGDAREQAELVGEFFAGIRLECANCHNHPLDRWTQDDYHGLAAVFARLDRTRHVRMLPRGEVTNRRTGEPAIPRLPGERDLPSEGDHRSEVAKWVLDSQHHHLARVTVNRLWQAMFGRGLVEPVDDLRSTNPATHPELLQELAEDFASHGFRIRHTLRQIALSKTYARSGEIQAGNRLDDRFYSRAWSRPLPAEVLIDAIADVTGVAVDYEAHQVHRAIGVIDPVRPADGLDELGRCRSIRGCRDYVAGIGGLATQLHLLNGDLVNQRLRDPFGRLQRSFSEGDSVPSIVNDWYLRAFCREPTAMELAYWRQQLLAESPEARRQLLEDFAWSLLNSRSFRENQ